MSAHPTFKMLVRPLPSEFDPTGYRRLRAMLKHMLRTHGIRCCSFEPVTAEDKATADDAERHGTEAGL